MADQFSGLDTRANRMRKIVHTCDLQHTCCFAHEKGLSNEQAIEQCWVQTLVSKLVIVIELSNVMKQASNDRSNAV